MKRLFTLVIAAMLTVTLAQAQNGWVPHRVDERISIKFPSEPREIVAGSFMASARDSSVAYVFTLVDFVKVAGIDSVALAPIKNSPEFAAQLKTGMGGSLPNVQLEDFKIGTWKGFTSYTTSGVDPQLKKYDIFMFIIGNKLYSLSTITKDGGSLEGRDTFWKSIQLNN